MAEPISLTVASLIAGGFLAEAGSGTWRTSTRIAKFLQRKFGMDQAALTALQQCEEEPSNQLAQEELRSAIDRFLADDQVFRDDLLALLENEGFDRGEVTKNSVAVSEQANVGKIVQIKTIQGDVNF